MEYYQRVRITIICESFLEEKIVKTIKNMGLKGYTILEARGEGDRGIQSGDFEYNKNIKLELLCKSATADKLCEKIYNDFFENYGIILYRNDNVSVLRQDKFN